VINWEALLYSVHSTELWVYLFYTKLNSASQSVLKVLAVVTSYFLTICKLMDSQLVQKFPAYLRSTQLHKRVTHTRTAFTIIHQLPSLHHCPRSRNVILYFLQKLFVKFTCIQTLRPYVLALIWTTIPLLPPHKFARCRYCLIQCTSEKCENDVAVAVILFHGYRLAFIPDLLSLLCGAEHVGKIWSRCG
jgi:hypothetical protein